MSVKSTVKRNIKKLIPRGLRKRFGMAKRRRHSRR
jgi:hypothetical protein